MKRSKSESVNQSVDIATMQQDIQYIKARLDAIEAKLDQHYLTKDEFDPYKKIITGMVGIFLTGVLAAILRLVLIK